MDCNSGKRKAVADALVERVTEVAKEFGLKDLVVHREANPVLVAARGELKGKKAKDGTQDCERIEFVLQISPDIARAEVASVIGADLTPNADLAAHRAFDLSDVVAQDSVARSAPEPDDDRC